MPTLVETVESKLTPIRSELFAWYMEKYGATNEDYIRDREYKDYVSFDTQFDVIYGLDDSYADEFLEWFAKKKENDGHIMVILSGNNTDVNITETYAPRYQKKAFSDAMPVFKVLLLEKVKKPEEALKKIYEELEPYKYGDIVGWYQMKNPSLAVEVVKKFLA